MKTRSVTSAARFGFGPSELSLNGVVRTLGRRASFWVVTALVAHTPWTSAASSMTYRLYASEWGLTQTVTSAIFAVFPLVVVAALIFLRDISAYIGHRSAILFGLSGSLNAPADRRGGVLSALYFVALVMQAVVVLLLGVAANAWGLNTAVDLGAVTMALLSICAIGLALSSGRRLPREHVSEGVRIGE
jgi:hypothetical protein